MMGALSVHEPLVDLLAAGVNWRVLSAHQRALNLISPDGEILSLVAPELGNGPATVVLAGEWPLPWTVGDVVRVAWAGAALWTPPPPPPPGVTHPGALAAATSTVAAEGSQDGVLPAVLAAIAGEPPPAGALAALAARGIAHLAAGRWTDGARGLAGLGPGLTPAGDDLLCGFVVALHRCGASAEAAASGAALGSLPASATTPFCRHLLRWAAAGVAPEHHLAWLDSILWGTPQSPGQLLAHGATSGADWAAGALLALHTTSAKEASACL